jgi:hypothetical protein
MRVHEDIFKPGDLVTWRNDEMRRLWPSSYPLGDRLTIKDIVPVPSWNIHPVGHTQLVSVMEDPEAREFSGAYIRHLAPWEK